MSTRYQIGPYQSVYRDQGSVKVNETLRQRFAENFAADDMLAGAVDQMQAADFAGDQALKKDLENRTRETLEQRAARGDFESMGMDVMKSARSFQKDYSPIQQNLQKYSAYQQSLKEARNKKIGEGGINEETYQRALQKSRHNYEGLQLNEDGTIDESSSFNGFNFVGDVDVSKLMDEAMKTYKPHEGGEEITEVAKPVPGKPGLYQVKRGNKYEIVPQEDVDRIFNDVVSDPNVQAALNQQAELRTFDMTDEDIQKNLLTQLDGDADDPESNGLRGALAKAVEDGDEETAAAYQSLIDRNEELLNGTGVETPEEMADLRKSFVKQDVKRQELEREQGAASSKFVRNNQFNTYAEDYDAMWLMGQKAELEAYLPTILTDTGVTQINNPGGATIDKLSDYVADMAKQEVGIMQELTATLGDLTNLQGQPLTADDIINRNYSDEIKAQSGEILDRYEGQLIHGRTQQAIQNTRLAKAKEAVGVDKMFEGFDSGSVEGMPIKDILSKAREITGNQNLDVHDLYGLLAENRDPSVALTYSNEERNTLADKKGARELAQKILGLDPNETGALDVKSNKKTYDFLTGYLKKYDRINSSANNKLNAELAKTAKLNAGSMSSSVAPGANNVQAKANTKAMDKEFVGSKVPENFTILYGGTVDRTKSGKGGSSIATFMKDNNMSNPPTVKKVRYPVTAIGGLQTIVFTVQGKDNEGKVVSKDILVPTSNLRHSGLDQMFASPTYRMDQLLDTHRNGGSLNPTIEYRNKDGVVTSAIRYDLNEGGKGSDVAHILDANGEIVVSAPADSKTITDELEHAHSKGYNFRTEI